MNLPQEMLIYNLFPLLAGSFTEWRSHFSRAKEMGFNRIFVNPIQCPGKSGSIYAVFDYFEINPALVDPDKDPSPDRQVKDMIASAREAGLEMITDLVINHCAVDSPLLKDHPEWFEWNPEGEVVHPFADANGRKVVWEDLARFDHAGTKDKEGLHTYFFRVIRHLMDLGFSAFRCDAAYQIPAALWERLIRETKEENPDALFLAETLGCTPKQTQRTVAAGFDYIFNSAKYWDYESRWLQRQYHLTRDTAPSIAFPESHDTERLAEELEGNINGIKQCYLFTALFSAGVMVPLGFEFGFRKKPDVVESTPEDWEQTGIDLREFITRVNKIKKGYRIFQSETPTLTFSGDNPQLLIMWKGSTRTDQEALLILNKDIENQQSFNTTDIYDFFESKMPIKDVSPQNSVEEVSAAFSRDLEPGGGIVLIAEQDDDSGP